MTAPDSSLQDAEGRAREESERHTLLYADKQLLANREYRELVRGFRARATGTMGLMGFLLVLQITFGVIHYAAHVSTEGDALGRWAGGFGRLLVVAVIAAMFISALRDRRRCSEALRKMDSGVDAK